MNRSWLSFVLVCAAAISLPSCGHDQELVSISIQPTTETFGSATIPVFQDAGLNVQLRAIGSYIHPPVDKDITNQVIWSSNTPQMVTVNSTGLITATGMACGNTLISATVKTNSSAGGLSSSGAIVTGTMTANVVCFTGTAGPLLTVSVSGTGTVSSNPAGISSCTSICNANFASGSAITLTATPTGSATSVTWSGCDSVSLLVCNINNLTANTVVTAAFS
jgi:Bacterial Ig-like domain (group 2)